MLLLPGSTLKCPIAECACFHSSFSQPPYPAFNLWQHIGVRGPAIPRQI